jgi:hypothetical protein
MCVNEHLAITPLVINHSNHYGDRSDTLRER